MQGDTPIKAIVKAVLVWKDKGNEIIKKVNRKWEGKMMANLQEDSQLGTVEIHGSDNKVKLNVKHVTVDLIACDDEGNQHTYRLCGYQLPD